MRICTRKAVLAAFALIGMSAFIQLAAQTTEIISVNEGRPVAKVLEALEKKHGLAITYEDPEYSHSSDLQDVTALVRRDGRDFPRVIVPKGGPFQFQYVVNNGKPQEDTTALIRRMLTEYASLGGPLFDVQERVTKVGTEWHVIPVEVRNKEGRFVAARPLLDNPISIPLEKRTFIDTLSLICEELSRISGHPVDLGTVPMNPLYAYRVEMGATNQPARDVLADLLKQLNMVWRLLYDPEPGSYGLNLHIAAAPPPAASPVSTTGSAPSASPSGPARSVRPPSQHLPTALLLHYQLTPERISQIQSALAHRGYYQGAPSGTWDANTVEALKKFESDNGLEPSGRPRPETLEKLGIAPASPSSPPPQQ